jgi:hypothetical protein
MGRDGGAYSFDLGIRRREIFLKIWLDRAQITVGNMMAATPRRPESERV